VGAGVDVGGSTSWIVGSGAGANVGAGANGAQPASMMNQRENGE